MDEYKILCHRCKSDLTERISKSVEPVIKQLIRYFLSAPNVINVGAKNLKIKLECPSCGYPSEYDVDLNKLAENEMERMK